ncbi:MAG: SH3 domain-containing protein [bacterium]
MKKTGLNIVLAWLVLICPTAFVQADDWEQARDRLAHGEFESAIPFFEKHIQSAPPSPAAYYEFGQALEKSGREADAALAYRRSLLLDPGFALAEDSLQKSNARLGIPASPLRWQDRLARIIPFDSSVVLGSMIFWIGAFLMLLAVRARKKRILILSVAGLLIYLGASACLLAGLCDPRIVGARQGMVMNLAGTTLYKVPSEDSAEKITILNQGSTVTVLSTRGRWLHVQVPEGQRGWCLQEGITSFVPSA